MALYRTHTADAPEPIKTKPDTPPGIVPDHRIPILDHKGRMRGHVGHKATSVTVSRFTGTLDNKLAEIGGRTVWIGAPPSGPNRTARAQNAKLAKSLNADKGSVKTLAETSAAFKSDSADGTNPAIPKPTIGGQS